MSSSASDEGSPFPVMPTAIYSVFCYIKDLDTPQQKTSHYLVGHYETRINAYVAMTMDFSRQKHNFGQLNTHVIEESIPGVLADKREKACMMTASRRFGWELEKVDNPDRVAAIDVGLVQGDNANCEFAKWLDRSRSTLTMDRRNKSASARLTLECIQRPITITFR